MAVQILCDGCESVLDPGRDVALEGQRADGLGGGGLPSGEFHLCMRCSVVAFHAAVTQTGPVDLHQLARKIGDAQRARKAGKLR